jgi:cation:H+ antiporter
MSLITFLVLVGGLVLLVVGAEFLVNGASKVAGILGISPLIIGLTVVAYGTSAPEMTVSVISSFSGQADIAVGNVVGSNIFNVLFILGISSLLTPLVVSQQIVRSDVPILIGVSILLLFFGLDGKISRVDGIIFFTGILTYTLSLIYQSRRQIKNNQNNQDNEGDEFDREYTLRESKSPLLWLKNIALIIGGLALLVVGSQLLVRSATTIAQALGVSDLLIGLTIVAIGTSLPELATSVAASLKGERDIAVGNVLGSNIFNILAVLGVSGIVSPDGLIVSDAVIRFDIPIAIAVAVACLPIFASGNRIDRWEGFLFTLYYVAYTIYLILDATNHDSLPIFSKVMLAFVLPITIITAITLTLQERKRAR